MVHVFPILYCTNYSETETRTLRARAFDENGTIYELGYITEILPNTVKKLTNEIYDALQAQGFNSGKVCITYYFTIDVENEFEVFIPVPVAVNELVFYATYNVGGADRGYVEVIYR